MQNVAMTTSTVLRAVMPWRRSNRWICALASAEDSSFITG
jgi:hypothetical protein